MRIRGAGLGLTVAAVLAAAAVGPQPAAGQAAVGVKAGVNVAGLNGSEAAETVTGLAAGAYLGFGLGDRLALQVELGYGVRGGGDIGIGANALDDTATPSDLRLSYIEVPLLLRAGYPGERFLPSLFLGPYAAFLVSCRLTTADGAEGECGDDTRPSWFDARETDYGLMVGGGLDMAVGESTVFVDVRYALGLLSIQDGDDAMDLRNGGLTIAGGFAIPLGR